MTSSTLITCSSLISDDPTLLILFYDILLLLVSFDELNLLFFGVKLLGSISCSELKTISSSLPSDLTFLGEIV